MSRALAWRAATIQGLLSGTVSTIVITLGAPEIGRARALDWMEIGTVLLRTSSVRAEPEWWNIAAGVFVHQAADLAWALVFFALGRRATSHLSAAWLLIVALPWAVVTSAIEYFVILPRLQPLVPMQVPYWTALGVHVTSALLYPFFPQIRSLVAGERVSWTPFGRRLAYSLTLGVAVLGGLELLRHAQRSLPWPFASPVTIRHEEEFMKRMTAHHEMGVELARLAAAHAAEDRLRMLGRLMIANQQSEIRILRRWWRSWNDAPMPALSEAERLSIPGMPSPPMMAALSGERGSRFDGLFVELMVAHHRGGIVMADEARQRAADPRLRLFADSIQHAQRGQVAAMLANRQDRSLEPQALR